MATVNTCEHTAHKICLVRETLIILSHNNYNNMQVLFSISVDASVDTECISLQD